MPVLCDPTRKYLSMSLKLAERVNIKKKKSFNIAKILTLISCIQRSCLIIKLRMKQMYRKKMMKIPNREGLINTGLNIVDEGSSYTNPTFP